MRKSYQDDGGGGGVAAGERGDNKLCSLKPCSFGLTDFNPNETRTWDRLFSRTAVPGILVYVHLLSRVIKYMF